MSTRYINTDLEIKASSGLHTLATAFEAQGFVTLNVSRQRYWHATFETGSQYRTAEKSIEAFLKVIEALDGEAATCWSNCLSRDVNVGYQCGDQPSALEDGLPKELLDRMVQSGLGLKLTLYAAETNKAESG